MYTSIKYVEKNLIYPNHLLTIAADYLQYEVFSGIVQASIFIYNIAH